MPMDPNRLRLCHKTAPNVRLIPYGIFALCNETVLDQPHVSHVILQLTVTMSRCESLRVAFLSACPTLGYPTAASNDRFFFSLGNDRHILPCRLPWTPKTTGLVFGKWSKPPVNFLVPVGIVCGRVVCLVQNLKGPGMCCFAV